MLAVACADVPASPAWRTSATVRSPGIAAAYAAAALRFCKKNESENVSRQPDIGNKCPCPRLGGDARFAAEVNGQRPGFGEQSRLRLGPESGQSTRRASGLRAGIKGRGAT